MSIITFWSNDNIETGQTMSMAAVATHMAIEHNYKILMIDTANNDKTLEDAFWSQTKKTIVKQKQDIGSGLSGLIRVIDSNRNSPEVITNYSKIIFKNRLELLKGDEMNVEEYKKMQETLQNIVLLANKYYDYVFIDLKNNKPVCFPFYKFGLYFSGLFCHNLLKKDFSLILFYAVFTTF